MNRRLLSLDVFRGVTIAGMILVNDAGYGPATYWPLQHAQWNGWTPTDLVFPFFVFMVGLATYFSTQARLAKGATRREIFGHALVRTLLLLLIGIILNGMGNHFHVAHWRFYGVLQRIALCYAIGVAFALWTDVRTQMVAAAVCLVGYWVLMRFVPVPGFGVPTVDIPILDPDRNLVAWLDRIVQGGHLYEKTRDPEGLLSTIPAIASVLSGLIAARYFRQRTRWTLMAGIVGVVLALLIHPWFPINKKLWTSSFVLLTAGLASIFISFLHWALDDRATPPKWTEFFVVFGKNAIAAYVLSELLAILNLFEGVYAATYAHVPDPKVGSLLYAISYVLLCWVVMYVLYRRRVFLKL